MQDPLSVEELTGKLDVYESILNLVKDNFIYPSPEFVLSIGIYCRELQLRIQQKKQK